MSIIANNQQVSPGVYSRTVQDQSALPIEFMRANAIRIDRAYVAGEPIWMIVAELKMVFETQPNWKPTKTPRALASYVRIIK